MQVLVYNWFMAQSVLKVRFVPQIQKPENLTANHAQRLENTTFILQRPLSNSLWRHDPHSAFLQQAQTPLDDTEICQDPSTQYQLSSFRSHPSTPLRHHGWNAENQQNRNSSIQRSFSLSIRTLQISGPVYAPAFSQKNSPQGYSATCYPAQSTSNQTLRSAQAPIQSHLRSGFSSPNSLWETSVCPSWLQSQKTRQALLSPHSMFRSPSSGILAWLLTTWKCRHGYRGRTFYQSLPLQSSTLYCPISHSIPSRFGILQQEDHRVPRPRRLWLCDGGQALPYDQIPGPGMSFPETEKWLGDSRVSIPTAWLESTAPFCRHSTAYPRRPSGGQATYSLQIQEICLPCFGHQFEDSSLESLEVLRPEGHHRKECSRTPLRLSSGQDSNRRLGSQRGFLPYDASGLQYCPLVQKAVSSKRISLHYTGYDTYRLLSLTSQVNQKRKSKCSGTAPRLSLPRAVRRGSQKDRQTQDLENFMNLQIPYFLRYSIFKGF